MRNAWLRSEIARGGSRIALGACAALALCACGDDTGGNRMDAGSDAAVDSGGAALCRPGETNCDGVCANLMTSAEHCGTCDTACTAPSDADPVCQTGECAIECHPEHGEADAGADSDAGGPVIVKTPCDGVCVDLEYDVANCGSCGNACLDPENGDPTCDEAACAIECDPGYDQCGDSCFNLLVDGEHCGDCDTACDTNEVCANGSCVLSCPSGQARCGNSCIDITKDPDNCGGCDNACPDVDHGDPKCTASTCGVKCDTNFSDCDGACVNKNTDENNCGACGNQCSTVNGTFTCTSGNCTKVGCDTNFDDCDTNVDTGCEADLTSEGTCGGCSTVCTGTGAPYCTDTASPGTFACDANCPDTVCDSGLVTQRCVDVTMDVGDCGGCNMPCGEPISGDATGDPTCASSACGVDCIAPSDTEVTRGGNLACVDTQTDPQACGDTKKQCAKGERCLAGVCTKDPCAPGLTNTDSGCVNLDSDGSNCGSPDATCSGFINPIGGGCPGGGCFCDAGRCRSDCGGLEVCDTRDCVNTATDPAHCGGCGNKCDPGQFCKGGACRDFLYASGDWECGADNNFPTACASGPNTICVKDGVNCP